ncbi:hypothetical protein E0H77_12545 [Acinetobacter sp. ANC 4633]|uniref:hypothetical protein n=1 Tax=Acinetobacter sp. ANC 4633 TaxID=2529845 RepID=UPI00103F8426|nr:hypothetical protein [Acinetobacter sp. ANC 4633]TCB23942.1 hypothetical protein E0H77_12545 [Acinetobacter sp. ANC 4633]
MKLLLRTSLILLCACSEFAQAEGLSQAVASLPHYQKDRNNSSENKSDDKYAYTKELRIITRGTRAKTSTAQVARLLLLGSNTSIYKDELVGNVIEDIQDRSKLKNPSEDIEKNLNDYLALNAYKNIQKTEKNNIRKITLEPARPYWSLLYNSSDKNVDNGYSLNFGAKTHVFLPIGAVDFSVNLRVTNKECSYTSEPKSLETWKANDYALVKDYRDKAIEICTKKYIEEIDKALLKSVQ